MHVPRESALETALPIHTLAFHPIALDSGETAIMLQLLERDSDVSATWERSMAEALSAPIGEWRRVWTDQERQRVFYELLEPKTPDIPAYPDFLADVLSAAVCAQIPCLEDHVRSLIRENNRTGAVPLCTDCGYPLSEH